MQYVYGAMLLHAAGKSIDEKGLTAVVAASGAPADATRVKALLASLEGVNIAEVLAKAETVAVAAAAPAPSGKGDDKKEGKKEEKEEKGVSEEEAAQGLSALFG